MNRFDPSRLAALRRAWVLDSGSERACDEITQLLASALGVPIAIVNRTRHVADTATPAAVA